MTLAVTYLYDQVRARMDADAAAQDPPVDPVPQSFGWREPARAPRAPRIVWVPGDDESGDVGTLGPARGPGGNPRSLGTLHELVTIYVESVDTSAFEDERAQYTATRLLFDSWLRAVYLAAYGAFSIQRIRWVNERKERRYGAALRVLLSIEALIPDEPAKLAPVDTKALIDVEELDVIETMEAAREEP